MTPPYIDQVLISGAKILSQYRAFWDFNAFKQNPAELDDLLRPIQSLTEPTLWQIDECQHQQATYFAEYFPQVFEWLNQYSPPKTNAAPLSIPSWVHRDIPGRKWQQIYQFYCALNHQTRGNMTHHLPAFEWCSGKGHLGRLYSYMEQQPVVSIECDFALCQAGTKLARKLDLQHAFINADIYHLPLKTTSSPQNLWVALHACGDLHRQFLHCVHASQPKQVAIAPCCYHRQQSNTYQTLSIAGKKTGLLLDNHALRLAQQNQITASQKERNQRAQELNWRLGYQALCKTHNVRVIHKSLPPLKSKQCSVSDFRTFSLWAATQHGWQLPKHIEWENFELIGQRERLNMMQKDAIRHCFRRLIELWLIFDKAMYLAEDGYTVTLQQFCEASVSPRNLLLLANHDFTLRTLKSFTH